VNASLKDGLKVGVATFMIWVAVRLIFDQVKEREFDLFWVLIFPAIVATSFGLIRMTSRRRQP
jgi:predicted tellurium resistance membrane protein TerC